MQVESFDPQKTREGLGKLVRAAMIAMDECSSGWPAGVISGTASMENNVLWGSSVEMPDDQEMGKLLQPLNGLGREILIEADDCCATPMIIGRLGVTPNDNADRRDFNRQLCGHAMPFRKHFHKSVHLGEIGAGPRIEFRDCGNPSSTVWGQERAHVNDGLAGSSGVDAVLYGVQDAAPSGAGFLDTSAGDLRRTKVSQGDRVVSLVISPALLDEWDVREAQGMRDAGSDRRVDGQPVEVVRRNPANLKRFIRVRDDSAPYGACVEADIHGLADLVDLVASQVGDHVSRVREYADQPGDFDLNPCFLAALTYSAVADRFIGLQSTRRNGPQVVVGSLEHQYLPSVVADDDGCRWLTRRWFGCVWVVVIVDALLLMLAHFGTSEA
jgi:hypothetical protein